MVAVTGIERLRGYARRMDELHVWPGGAKLREIAEQIERELEDEQCSDIETVRSDAYEALEWMRDHGGLDHVKAEWHSRVPHERYEAKRQRLLGHIAECETALGRRNQRIEELGRRVSDLAAENAELRKRAMPEGCEWPTVDGRKVDFKTPYQPSLGVLEAVSIYSNGACEVMSHDGIIKPVSEIHVVVLAADGEPLEVGQTVYGTRDLEPVEIVSLRSKEYDGVRTVKCKDRIGFVFYAPDDLTHQRPVLDADGVPIKVGDTVWDTDAESDTPLTVVEVSSDLVRCEYTWKDGKTYRPCYPPDQLTHTKPEPPDSWERIEEDARGLDSGVDRELFTHTHEDIVRRCKALAEKENRNE